MLDQDKAGQTGGATDTGGVQDAGVKTEKKYSEKDLESAVDRRVQQALDTARKRWDSELESKIEAERKAAEDKRLAEQGEFQKLAEARQAELDALRAERAAAKFRDESRAAMVNAGISPELADVLLEPKGTIDSVQNFASGFGEKFKAAVEAEVSKRLDTGKQTPGKAAGDASTTGVTKVSQLKTDKDKADFIGKHGLEAYQKLER